MIRENFYIILELPISPPENDINKINATISKKQADWSILRNHPTKGREGQRYLDLLPEMTAVMKDDIKRQEEARQAKIILAQKEKEKFKDLDDAIQLLSARKQITEAELKKLAQKFSIPEEEVKNRIKVPIVKNKSEKKTVEKLEPSVQKKISDALKIIGKKSLYDFLELSPTSSLGVLNSRTKEKDIQLKSDSHKDARLTSGQELIGHCMTVFKTGEMREMYNAALAFENLDELNKLIEIAGLDNKIDVEEYDSLMKKAMEMGLKFAEAEEHIFDYCMKKRWIVRAPTRPLAADMKQCGNCGLLNNSDSKNCSGCGYPLEVICPKCKKENPSTNINCGKCGFSIGDMPNALPLVKEADEAQAGGDIKKAAGLFRKALLFWPDYPRALSAIRQIEAGENEISNLVKELHELVNDSKYYNARQVLAKLKQQDNASPHLTVETTINAKINAAESWLKKAQTASNDNDAIDYLNQALLECRDYKEAIESMTKYPPEHPQKLEAVASSHSILLRWGKCNSRGAITYRIARKCRSLPLNPLDGENLGETAQTFFNDQSALPGLTYYYAVYSKRGEIFSMSGANAGPLARTAEEVANLKGYIDYGKLYLEWNWPTGAQNVLVMYNNQYFPTGTEDYNSVKRIYSRAEYLQNSGFILRTVEPKEYYFTIFVTAGEGENAYYSRGSQYLVTNSGHIELYYEIHLVKNILGKVKAAQLKLFGKENKFNIPRAVLVKKSQNLPLRKTDGFPILEIGPMDISASPTTIDIPVKEIGKGGFAKLFFMDDAQHQRYRIMSPPREKLELG